MSLRLAAALGASVDRLVGSGSLGRYQVMAAVRIAEKKGRGIGQGTCMRLPSLRRPDMFLMRWLWR